MKNIFKTIVPMAALALTGIMSSCVNDLNFESASDTNDPNINQPFNPEQMYAKCYASLIMEGNDCKADFSLENMNDGLSCFLRNIYNLECLGTDESICWWTDGGLINVCYNQATPQDEVLKYMYYRSMSNITYCNHFLNNEPCKKLGEEKYAEVRWLRAFNYYMLANEFGNVPFLTNISSEAAPRATQAEMYQWLIDEFTACAKTLMDAKPEKDTDTQNYGRVDKAAAWLMLSRLYLNANVWNKKNTKWTEDDYKKALEASRDYAKKVIDAGFVLSTEGSTVTDKLSGQQVSYTGYEKLFMADNGSSSAYVEAVLPLLQDHDVTRGWGGTVFFLAAHAGSDQETVTGLDNAYAGGWRGMRVRKQFLQKFANDVDSWGCSQDFEYKTEDDGTKTIKKGTPGKTAKEIRSLLKDDRALFWGWDHTVDITHNSKDESFNQGLVMVKFSNRRSDGETPTVAPDKGGVDGDFFLLRAAEAYLNIAEAEARLNGGALATGSEGAKAMDAIRNRAHANTLSSYTLANILDERAREFYCEGYRRTDLIRFGQFGGNSATYNWAWKGGNAVGQPFDEYRNLYPIPSSELLANKNLKQNDGYPD